MAGTTTLGVGVGVGVGVGRGDAPGAERWALKGAAKVATTAIAARERSTVDI